jgi:pyrroline-5-carboxylate reductase
MAGYQLGILGAGNMAEAIARGVIRGGLLRPEQIIAADVSVPRRELFTSQLQVPAVDDNRQAASQSVTLLLSVKPQHMAQVLDGIAPVVRPGTLIISIAAGISTRFIESHLGGANPWHVIRAMPNTPMLVGEGMVALSRGQHATADDARRARELFEAAADVIDVPEDQLDAVTAVSGSGPAYFFYLVEQMIRAAVELGISPEHARQLSVKTALGAAKMLCSSQDSPQELRRWVTSPGGTTQAALTHLENNGAAATIIDAIKAAQRRGKELGT